ncbi:hypothetical protein ACFO3O_14400 [Dokdonia ponticola]|uniref:DUF4747 family protein n=1 Tax=Dokdonia ponticola TaxID=2041041 RepID=A0ABV9HY59_9FLAO
MFYKALFNINIHHGYFLDSGEDKFLPIEVDDTELPDIEKEKALIPYNVHDYLKVIPTQKTQRTCRNHRMLIRPHKQGFRVLVETQESGEKFMPIIPFDDDAVLTFEVHAKDAYFHNYTDLIDISENRCYLFSNIVPEDQIETFESIFENSGGLIDERFLLKAPTTRELLKNIAAEDAAINTTIIEQFSITNVIELIEADETLTELQKEGEIEKALNKLIQEKKKKGVVGHIRMHIKGDDDNNLLEFDDTDPDNIIQYTLETTPEFTLSFINKKTFWRYISVSDNATLTTNSTKWSTKNGFIEIKTEDFDPDGLDPADTNPEDYVFPNPTVKAVKKEDDDYYSEIFI